MSSKTSASFQTELRGDKATAGVTRRASQRAKRAIDRYDDATSRKRSVTFAAASDDDNGGGSRAGGTRDALATRKT